MEGVLCLERYGTRKDLKPTVYIHEKTSGRIKTSGRDYSRATSFLQVIKTVFLPQGYPESVSDDYLEYQVWDTLQAFCSSITGALATQAVLKGSGVGDESASVAGATITWLLKDGTGMVGRIAFAYYKGTNLDRDAKKWRLFADVLNDFAIFITLIAPLFPKSYFTPITCLAGLAFSLVGVAGSCTRAALTMHQAKRDNMADVSAKDGSQETLVNLAGLIINLFLIPFVSGNLPLTWTLFAVFTFLHIYSNYRAVTCVVMNTLNYARLKILVNHYFLSPGNDQVLSPKEANAREPIIGSSEDSWLKIGCKLEELRLESASFTGRLKLEPQVKFISKHDVNNGVYLSALRDTCEQEDVVKVYCEAEILRILTIIGKKSSDIDFVEKLRRNGWDTSHHQLFADEWRWSTEELDKIK